MSLLPDSPPGLGGTVLAALGQMADDAAQGHPGLDCRITALPPAVLLEVVGDVDLQTADVFAASLRAALAETPLHLLIEVDRAFLDLRAARSLLEAAAGARDRGVTLALCGATATLRRVLALMDESALLLTFPAVPDAVAAFGLAGELHSAMPAGGGSTHDDGAPEVLFEAS